MEIACNKIIYALIHINMTTIYCVGSAPARYGYKQMQKNFLKFCILNKMIEPHKKTNKEISIKGLSQ
jgi:hypothetical protein